MFLPGAVWAQDVIDPGLPPLLHRAHGQDDACPAREAEIKRIFAEFDRNKDGFITEDEAPRLPHSGNDLAAIKADAKFFVSLYDDNEDHRVSLEEYRRQAALALIGREKRRRRSNRDFPYRQKYSGWSKTHA